MQQITSQAQAMGMDPQTYMQQGETHQTLDLMFLSEKPRRLCPCTHQQCTQVLGLQLLTARLCGLACACVCVCVLSLCILQLA